MEVERTVVDRMTNHYKRTTQCGQCYWRIPFAWSTMVAHLRSYLEMGEEEGKLIDVVVLTKSALSPV